ncbi:MAG: RNA 2',3'-cyclic phosphodiesterase [Deltaproteobacteria bacterium]|nr:RNA 2',3'-cyclic phosphodiesterase [Deltaproteobacteria bacterium]MBW2414546.1 RNA 2',3'-cyclic phosphodiesterase [Deltaproteobacteria bacterium]
MSRLFFAVELPGPVRDEAARVAEQMRQTVTVPARWTPVENLHVTLKFIAELDADRLPKLIASAAGKLARVGPFRVELAGSGAFPNHRAARVLWIGIGEGRSTLARLARKLDASAGRQGAERDRQPFRAHLTVARLRDPAPVPLEGLPAPDSLAFEVEEVVLYESRLSSTGATHVPLTRLPLGASEDSSIEFAPEP